LIGGYTGQERSSAAPLRTETGVGLLRAKPPFPKYRLKHVPVAFLAYLGAAIFGVIFWVCLFMLFL
jgi:hypothetical protein